MPRAIFLDRDGTLNEDVGHVNDPDRVQMIPGSAEAAKRLADAGFLLIGVTNQAAVARGIATEEQVQAVNQRVEDELAKVGVKLERFYYCPHHPEIGDSSYTRLCGCRKPAAGMLYRAAGELGVDLEASFMVGDHLSDIEAGTRAGCRTVLLLTGHGKQELESAHGEERRMVDFVADDLVAAAEWILAQKDAN